MFNIFKTVLWLITCNVLFFYSVKKFNAKSELRSRTQVLRCKQITKLVILLQGRVAVTYMIIVRCNFSILYLDAAKEKIHTQTLHKGIATFVFLFYCLLGT